MKKLLLLLMVLMIVPIVLAGAPIYTNFNGSLTTLNDTNYENKALGLHYDSGGVNVYFATVVANWSDYDFDSNLLIGEHYVIHPDLDMYTTIFFNGLDFTNLSVFVDGVPCEVAVNGCEQSYYSPEGSGYSGQPARFAVVNLGETVAFNGGNVSVAEAASACSPSWSCSHYEQCISPAPFAYCDSVVDDNSCGEAYSGDYSELNTTCEYSGGGGGASNDNYVNEKLEQAKAQNSVTGNAVQTQTQSQNVFQQFFAWLRGLFG